MSVKSSLAFPLFFSSSAIYIYIIILFTGSHFLFLNADADSVITTKSRGAWTDEGLNTCQIRNYINHGNLNLLDCDNFLKTPLLSLFVYPFFILFGTKLFVGRSLIILFTSVVLLFFLFNRKNIKVGIAMLLTTFTFFPIYQYTHLILSEVFSSILILMAIYQMNKNFDKITLASLTLIHFILLLAVLFKIQFFYVLLIPTIKLSIDYWKSRSRDDFQKTIKSFSLLVIISVLVFSCWYLPFTEGWKLISRQQSGGFSFNDQIYHIILRNIYYNFTSRHVIVFSSVFLFSLIFLLRRKNWNAFSSAKKNILTLSMIWVFLEFHKLLMSYLPDRYLVSTYFSMGLLFSILFFYERNKNHKYFQFSSIAVLLIFSLNVVFIYQAFLRRTFSLREANNTIKKVTTPNDIVIGPWAPSVTWDSKCLSIPVWNNFLGGRNIIKDYQPNIIISETDEADSGHAYQLNNIDLSLIGTPFTAISIAHWKLVFYKVK